MSKTVTKQTIYLFEIFFFAHKGLNWSLYATETQLRIPDYTKRAYSPILYLDTENPDIQFEIFILRDYV